MGVEKRGMLELTNGFAVTEDEPFTSDLWIMCPIFSHFARLFD